MPAGCYFQPMGSTDGVTLISPDPKTIGVTNSVYVNCSLCTQSNVGSQQTSVLSWVPSSVIIENGCVTDVTNLNKPVFYAPFLSRVWQPVSQKYIRDITVNFTLSTGALIPTVSGTFSTVVLAIRTSGARAMNTHFRFSWRCSRGRNGGPQRKFPNWSTSRARCWI